MAEGISAHTKKNLLAERTKLFDPHRDEAQTRMNNAQADSGAGIVSTDHAARRDRLIEYLLKERGERLELPDSEEARFRLLRGLMNVRPPEPVERSFLEEQDEYWHEENLRRGVADVASFVPAGADSHLFLWQGDITRLNCDAIVNAANSAMLGCFSPCHSCIDNCIHTYAGIRLRLACAEIMREQGHPEETGGAKITPAFALPSRFVLHTVGPIVSGHVNDGHRRALESCYRSCLELASEKGLNSIAFCCISTGVFHFPAEEAARIAVAAVKDFMCAPGSLSKVIFDVFNDADRRIYERLLTG